MRPLLGFLVRHGYQVPFAMILGGQVGVPLRRYLALDAVSSLTWAAAFIGLGYAFAGQLEAVLDVAVRFGGSALILAAAALLAYLAVKLWQRRRLLQDLELTRIAPAELK